MTNEELKNIWAQQTLAEPAVSLSPESIWSMAKTSERFERAIFWRDAREWSATAVVAGVFLFAAFAPPTIHWLLMFAAILACGPMTYVATRRRKRPAADASGTLIDHLRESIASVRHQIGLLRSVFWWYLLPLALSLGFVFIDRLQSKRVDFGIALFFSVVVAILVFFGVWKLNERAVRTDLEPRLCKLEKALRELESTPADSQDC